MAASLGVIACLAIGQSQSTPPEELAADAWIVEHGVEVVLTDLSQSYQACYAATLPSADAVDGRSRMALASTCGGDLGSELT